MRLMAHKWEDFEATWENSVRKNLRKLRNLEKTPFGQNLEKTWLEAPPGLEPPTSFANPGRQQVSLPLPRPPPGLELPTSFAGYGCQEDSCWPEPPSSFTTNLTKMIMGALS